MENDNFDNYVERGFGQGNGAFSNISSAGKMPMHSMPSFEDILKNKSAIPHPVVQNIEKEFVSKMVEKISDSSRQERSEEMPSFNLGEQILAGQRKVAALKRKSPSSNSSPKADKPIRQKAPELNFVSAAPASPQQQIIADIVAKEILALTSAK